MTTKQAYYQEGRDEEVNMDKVKACCDCRFFIIASDGSAGCQVTMQKCGYAREKENMCGIGGKWFVHKGKIVQPVEEREELDITMSEIGVAIRGDAALIARLKSENERLREGLEYERLMTRTRIKETLGDGNKPKEDK